MHELDPAYGMAHQPDPQQAADVLRWRKAERKRLIEDRLRLEPAVRQRHSLAIADRLEKLVGDVEGLIVSAYWPFRGEPDLRQWLEQVWSRGGRCALPIVVEKGAPLIFREWRQGDRLERGVWNIPGPVDGLEVVPDIVVAPLVGFDRQAYRLGYGGGFFDRTLAVMEKRPTVIGVGYSIAALPSICPLDHDIPMDLIATEAEAFFA